MTLRPGMVVDGTRAEAACSRYVKRSYVAGAVSLVLTLALAAAAMLTSQASDDQLPEGATTVTGEVTIESILDGDDWVAVDTGGDEVMVPLALVSVAQGEDVEVVLDADGEAIEVREVSDSRPKKLPILLWLAALLTAPMAVIGPVRARRTGAQFGGDLVVVGGEVKGRLAKPSGFVLLALTVSTIGLLFGWIVLIWRRPQDRDDTSLPRIDVTSPRRETLYLRKSAGMAKVASGTVLIPKGIDVRSVRAVYSAGADEIIPVAH